MVSLLLAGLQLAQDKPVTLFMNQVKSVKYFINNYFIE